MTYAANEDSVEGGRPIELYEFTMGFQTWRRTSAEDSITIGVNTYTPKAIQRTAVGYNSNHLQDDVIITMPATEEFVRNFITVLPGNVAVVTIQRVHRGDLGGDEETIVIFKGTVKSVTFEKDGQEAKVVAQAFTLSLARQIPRRTFQGLCNHVIFDERCTLNEASYSHVGEVTDITGNDITVDGLDGESDGYYSAGYMMAPDGDRRMVLSHAGEVATLWIPFSNLSVGDMVTVYAGCDNTLAVCKSKFNNVVNYGGFPYVPKKNIFQSGII